MTRRAVTLRQLSLLSNGAAVCCYAAKTSARADDEWSTLNRHRSSLMAQIDGGKLAPLLAGHVLSASQQTAIRSEPERERRTAMLLDWLETKPTDAYHAFVEAIGELYPHIYLELTGRDDDGMYIVKFAAILLEKTRLQRQGQL